MKDTQKTRWLFISLGASVAAVAAGFWLQAVWHASASRTAYHLVTAIQQRAGQAFLDGVELDTLVADGLTQLNAGTNPEHALVGGLVGGVLALMNGQIVAVVREQLRAAIDQGALLGHGPPPQGDGVLGQILVQSRFAAAFFQRRGAAWLAAVYTAENGRRHGVATVVELRFKVKNQQELLPLLLEFHERDGVQRLARLPNLFAVLAVLHDRGGEVAL